MLRPTRLACTLPILVLAACGMVQGLAAGTGSSPDDQQSRQESLRLRRTPVVEVFESSRDSVVNISTTEVIEVQGSGPFDRMLREFFEVPTRPRRYTRQGIGSGFVIHPDGYLVTNAHVVAGATELKATFASGREYEARVIADDTTRDLAILKIDAERSLPTLRLGRSDDLMVGETVVAIGNPLGYQHTVTAGVVSAIGRDLEFPNGVALPELIQTDASINPGNSGGPLMNVLGELIGVNTAIRGDAENIGFAIPVDQLREILPRLLDVHRRYRIDSGLVLSSSRVPRVEAVGPGSPADDAGIRVGDVVRAIDSSPVREGVDFYIGLIGKQAGDRVRLEVDRGGRSLDRQLVLAGRPRPDGDRLARSKLGVRVRALPEDIARDLRLPGEAGIFVLDVEVGGPADRGGIEARDIIMSVGRYHVTSVEELGQLLELADADEQIPVRCIRVERGRLLQRDLRVRVR
ncbi:MAG: trypsin-like peptidase domain-containing protein [Planctomycetota bacterium]|jgi:serine protease Do